MGLICSCLKRPKYTTSQGKRAADLRKAKRASMASRRASLKESRRKSVNAGEKGESPRTVATPAPNPPQGA